MNPMQRRISKALSFDTERRRTRGQRKRKRLLSEILDALNELSNQDTEPEEQDPIQSLVSSEDDSELPSTAQSGPEGAQPFFRFQRRINELDKELENLAHTFRQLGSSGMVSPSFRLRTRISIVLSLFRKNTTKLFPELLLKLEDPPELPWSIRWKVRLERFPEELEYLASDLMVFLGDLHEFPELTHEPLKASVLEFTGDLEYWASCLRDFKDQFGKDPAVQRYMHDLNGKMEEHLRSITIAINSFVEVVVPAIRVAKQQTATTLLSLSGLATFVSAVTATGIQISFDMTDGSLSTAVNAFWFSSLVFSVASAANALLGEASILIGNVSTSLNNGLIVRKGLAWAQSPYRSPRNRVPWWISIWIRRSPLIFLVGALVAFSVGLVIFTWASSQHIVTCLMATVFTGIGFFSLIIVSVWSAFEKTTFIRHNGQRLFVDVLSDFNGKWMHAPRFIQTTYAWTGKMSRKFLEATYNLARASLKVSCQSTTDNERELPFFNPVAPAGLSMEQAHPPFPVSLIPHQRPVTNPAAARTTLSLTRQLTPEAEAITGIQPHLPGTAGFPPGFEGVSTFMFSLVKARSSVFDKQGSISQTQASNMLTETDAFDAHQDPVSHLQFSPDGRWLATGSMDRTSVFFKIGDGIPFTPHQALTHPLSVRRVAWAPRGGHLLALQLFCMTIWNKDGVYVNTMEQNPFVESAAWLPSGKAFLSLAFSADGSDVNTTDLDGNLLVTYHLPRLDLRDLAVTPDGQHMVGVGDVIEPPDSSRLLEAKKETRIIVYNLSTKAIESQVPVSQPFDNIMISRNGRYILVSHNGAGTMELPQLWHLDKAKGAVSLSLCRTYTPSEAFTLPTRCCFGGRFDQLIICAGRGGHMNIWDRDSGTLLHSLQPDGDVTCVAWNTAYDSPMLATGTTDGRISIWTLPRSRGNESHPNLATLNDCELVKEEELG